MKPFHEPWIDLKINEDMAVEWKRSQRGVNAAILGDGKIRAPNDR